MLCVVALCSSHDDRQYGYNYIKYIITLLLLVIKKKEKKRGKITHIVNFLLLWKQNKKKIV